MAIYALLSLEFLPRGQNVQAETESVWIKFRCLQQYERFREEGFFSLRDLIQFMEPPVRVTATILQRSTPTFNYVDATDYHFAIDGAPLFPSQHGCTDSVCVFEQ